MQKNVLLSNNLTKKKAVINMKKKLHAFNKIQYLLSSNFNWNFLEMFLNKPSEMYILIDAILLDQELQYQATQLYNWSVEHRWCGDHFYFCDGNRPALPPLWLHLGSCPLCHGSQLSHLFLQNFTYFFCPQTTWAKACHDWENGKWATLWIHSWMAASLKCLFIKKNAM